ncbi:MAG: hypothetical protein H7836_15995 [Magnetococcus sp. YQC-3]
MNIFSALKGKINSNKIQIFEKLGICKEYTEIVELDITPEFDSNQKYNGLDDGSYFVQKVIKFSSEYFVIVSAVLLEYGFHDDSWEDDDLVNDYDNGRVSLEIERIAHRIRTIYLSGWFHGSSAEMSIPVKVVLGIAGLSRLEGRTLSINNQMFLEGYLNEQEGNMRSAFFSFFSAFESYVVKKIDEISICFPKELRESMTKLSLKDKISLCFRETFKGTGCGVYPDINLESIESYKYAFPRFCNHIETRNKIAHGTLLRDIEADDVYDVFAIVLIMIVSIDQQMMTIKEIRDYLLVGMAS